MNNVMQALMAHPWAIRPEALEQIAAIAEREHEYAGNIEALQQKLGRPLANTRTVETRDGMAIIPVTGPLFRYANLFTEISGATSYEILAKDFKTAVDDPSIRGIVLSIDSPGGQVNGVSELAQQIAAARGIKPITAYIGGDGASAAYWIASATDRIVAADSAIVGSIGAMVSLTVEGEKAGRKTYRVVSSQSPLKNASVETEAGQRELQRVVDELAQVFVDGVASNRGISTEDVLSKYGQGAIFTGREAKKRLMVDEISNFESVLQRLSSGGFTSAGNQYRGTAMDITLELVKEKAPAVAEALRAEGAQGVAITAEVVKEKAPAVAEALVAEGKASVDVAAAKSEATAAERKRILDIQGLALAGQDALVVAAIADGQSPEAFAMASIKAHREVAAGALAGLKTADGQAAKVGTAPDASGKTTSPEAQADADTEALRKLGVIR